MHVIPFRLIQFCGYLAACLMIGPGVVAASSPAERDLFEVHVRPTLVKHCIQCHGETEQEGGLKLTTLEGLLAGGDSGPAIVREAPDESLLIEALRFESFEMPPSGQLDDPTVSGIAKWIAAGAPWPDRVVLTPTPTISEDDREWWCYQPISDPEVPKVEDAGWCRNEIDHFVFARLTENELTPSAEATPDRLQRRVHFALTGLPPCDASPNAQPQGDWYAAQIDSLLGHPEYGEHQARFWLDLVRYADSDGYNADHARPHAHLYRDYVIRSFNDDKPYDRFVREQLAGDEIDPGNRDALIGTMYLRHWIYEWNQRDVEGQWQEILSDVTETTADVFLAQGLKCAKCHDHKFDPLLQRDFFAMKAFFTPLLPREDMPVADVPTREEHLRQLHAWEEATETIRSRLHEIETPVLLAHATREGVDKFTEEIQSMIGRRRRDRTLYEHQIASLASNQFDLHPDKLSEWMDGETETERQHLRGQLAELAHLKPKPLPTLPFVAGDVGTDSPPTRIPDHDGPPIEPGYPTILDPEPADIVAVPTALQSTGRRSTLAAWITDPQNPLTARVIVNRVWQQHFGRGLVETASDFGRLGTPPSHPELLDWLATRFIEDGWSLKKLHRRILMSATYRQSSTRLKDEHIDSVDPQNVLLWRMNPRRLSGEEIHDAMLAACDELGPEKRAIYKNVKRNRLDPFLAAFDFPDRVRSQGKRHRTTTSPQALMLMNNKWVHDRAKRLEAQHHDTSLHDMIQAVHQQLFHRDAGPQDHQRAAQFMLSYPDNAPEQSSSGKSQDDTTKARLALLHAYLCSSEMIYVD
ncbi:PSD1 and planctomycete cytochrome C domain-containing protein [Rhodopirellula halodulae]|uniref:PSD1 and planctomycete cytochrome C domain-containing protein n=1 Tax=Rhodopirellula halodulae TaxID=2894198 RepID=UPI0032F9FB02|nr:PSD1 and planctomycete cytochrome C domain-containing protein [Rhodopirellula sp. JC737]